MAVYPKRGERYQHIKGWTVFILGVRYRDSVRVINPEFYCEVRFFYESSYDYTEMPLEWFNAVYRKISNSSHYYRRQEQRVQQHTPNPDYSWLDDDKE